MKRVANIKTDLRKFFHYWVQITGPLHSLGKTDKKVLAELLYYRFLLEEEVTDEVLLNKLLFNYDTKLKISVELNLPHTRVDGVLTSLRKSGIVKGKTLNTAYAPGIKRGNGDFTFEYKFKISGNEERVNTEEVPEKIAENSESK